MKTIIFIEIQAHFTKSFLKKTTDGISMLRLSEAIKNEVMRIKIDKNPKFLRRTLGFLIF